MDIDASRGVKPRQMPSTSTVITTAIAIASGLALAPAPPPVAAVNPTIIPAVAMVNVRKKSQVIYADDDEQVHDSSRVFNFMNMMNILHLSVYVKGDQVHPCMDGTLPGPMSILPRVEIKRSLWGNDQMGKYFRTHLHSLLYIRRSRKSKAK